jgi:AraC-like DNA-binding protein
MATIPITWVLSIFVTLLAAMLAVNGRLPPVARVCFVLGLMSMAVVAALIGLRLEYGMADLGRWQPHFAMIPAPAIWLGFRSLMLQDEDALAIVRLTLAVVAVAQVALFLPGPWSADIAVTTVNLIYALAFTVLLRKPIEAVVHIAPQQGRTLRIGLVGAVMFVLLIVAADASILLATLSAGQAGMIKLLTGASGLVVACVVLGAVVGFPLALSTRSKAPSEPRPKPAQAEDRAVFGRLEALMRDSQIFADPNLSLARLGRGLGVPARDVSVAVNRITGDNVSRYINGYRIQRAAELFRTTRLPVTEIMLDVGFVSKSTFNAEFRRIHDQTPREHRRSAQTQN